MLEKTTRVNYLFDFYQSLLTPKQRNYMDMYYREDYSLGEISDLLQVSRQAVYDNIRRTETMLESYEKKLGLYDKFQKRAAILDRMDNHATDNSEMQAFIHQLKELE
ncbi:putative DNA-binding protein [Lentibacillus sp. CBA3610]|uniref:putative DNA-binding protein n=1 Tax=Lentibacillus sp. CBA3610 TaxID=2518176 RepID=UPI001595FF0D|nr:putative DNA-binding protein [Lentibacillus sp. CBA3610]QKY69008.1 putative DNA-binding protein [Lentibacillus sp. CBA3610]